MSQMTRVRHWGMLFAACWPDPCRRFGAISCAIQTRQSRTPLQTIFDDGCCRNNAYTKGTLVLPHRVASKFTVLVFVKEESLVKKAKELGADFVGGEELVPSVSEG